MTGSDRRAHGLIIRKGFKHDGPINFGLQKLAEPVPIFDRHGSFGVNAIVGLRQPYPVLFDHTNPRTILFLPAEDLAGIQRGRQVVIANAENN